jgi:hypothetical protein
VNLQAGRKLLFFSRFFAIFCPQNKAHPVPTPYILV